MNHQTTIWVQLITSWSKKSVEKTSRRTFISFIYQFYRLSPSELQIPNFEQFGGARDEFEFLEFIFSNNFFEADGDWYPTENGKFNYVFSRLKNFAQTQIFPKVNATNVLKINIVDFFL